MEAISPRPSFPEHRLELASCVDKDTRVYENSAEDMLDKLTEILEETIASKNHPICVIIDNLSTLKVLGNWDDGVFQHFFLTKLF